ncbi:Uncharacterised protein [Mycobacteroides abscessus subsp. abscessus]|nr:Uncharacterised protein [Mycobacteroides abscessus subsp. abscessus]
MARALRSHKQDITCLWRHNLMEMDIESMREKQGLICQIRLNFFLIDFRLKLIRQEDHDNIALSNRLSNRKYREPIL